MLKHEQGCTKNLNRVCGFCAIQEVAQVPLKDLMERLDGITEENQTQKLIDLRDASHNCPACILTALRHHPRTTFDNSDYIMEQVSVDFKFKDEAKAFWDERSNFKNRHLHYDQ